jgi:hypothetical protein
MCFSLWSTAALEGVLDREFPAIPIRVMKPQAEMGRSGDLRPDLIAGVF